MKRSGFGAAVVLATLACGDGPLWPYDEGDRYVATIVQEHVFPCARAHLNPPPEPDRCPDGDTSSLVLVGVDSIRATITLRDRLVLDSVRGFRGTPEFEGTVRFNLSADLAARRCVPDMSCEDASVQTEGVLSRQVEYCPVVHTFAQEGGPPTPCDDRPGDTLVTVTIHFRPTSSAANWQPVLRGEETDHGAAGESVVELPTLVQRSVRWVMTRE